MNKEILVIFTGGTIGSSIRDGIIAPDSKASARLIEDYEREYPGEEKFKIISPLSILSENATPAQFSEICRIIEGNREMGYKGIIVTYGSDTLSFVAAFTGLALKNRLSCPVVFVAANRVLSDPESNGYNNFAGAVQLINQLSKAGFYNDVYAIWHSGSVFAAYKGTELTEADAGSHNHGAFGGEPFAELYPDGPSATGEGFRWRVALNDSYECKCGCELSDAELEGIFNSGCNIPEGVIAVRAYPGINFNRINLSGAKAVLVYGYHSGTFPNVGESESFYVFARKLSDMGLTLYGAPFKKEEAAVYESAKEMGEAVIRLEEVSFEAAYAYVLLKEACGVALRENKNRLEYNNMLL